MVNIIDDACHAAFFRHAFMPFATLLTRCAMFDAMP